MRMCLCIDLLCGILHTTHKKHVNILLDLKLVTKHILILREFDLLFVEEEIEEIIIKIDFFRNFCEITSFHENTINFSVKIS